MRNYNLGFISDEAIYEHVRHTVESYRREINRPDILTGLYMLAFATYDGFENFTSR